jgi:hypothetical protein
MSSSPQFLSTTILLSVSMNLTPVHFSCKWNHAVFFFSYLPFFSLSVSSMMCIVSKFSSFVFLTTKRQLLIVIDWTASRNVWTTEQKKQSNSVEETKSSHSCWPQYSWGSSQEQLVSGANHVPFPSIFFFF